VKLHQEPVYLLQKTTEENKGNTELHHVGHFVFHQVIIQVSGVTQTPNLWSPLAQRVSGSNIPQFSNSNFP
jgi:hypothetical protein